MLRVLDDAQLLPALVDSRDQPPLMQ
jgi:hypothetical protein